jgi:chromosome segregation ATPase
MEAVERMLVKLAIIVAAMMLLANPVFLSVSSQEEPVASTPPGLDLSASIMELIQQHKQAITAHIMDIKTLISKTGEERLEIIEEYHSSLREKIQSILDYRRILLEGLRNGTITPQEFALEMRKLKAELQGLGRFSEKLGWKLGELGRELAGNLKEIAERFIEENKLFAEEVRELHNQTMEELGISLHMAAYRNTTKCDKLQALLNMLDQKISKLEELKEKILEKMEELKSKIAETNRSLEQTVTPCLELMENLTARLNKLKEEISKLNITRSESLGRLKKLQEGLDELRKREEEVRQRINELEDRYRRMEEERRELERSLNATMRGEVKEKIKSKLQEILGEVNKLMEEKGRHNELLSKIREEIEKNHRMIEDLKKNIQQIVEEVKEKVKEHGNISKMIEELRGKCGRGNMTLAKMNITKHLMEKKLEFLEKELRRVEMKIEMLTQWRREISDRIAQLCKQPTTGA